MESELFNDPNEIALLNVPKPKRPKYKWKGIHVPSKAKPAWLERAKTSHAAILEKYGKDGYIGKSHEVIGMEDEDE